MRITKWRPKPWQWRVIFVIAIAPAVFAVGLFIFLMRGEVAFDETRCPFQETETRAISSTVRMREDTRICLDGVEEHRWTILREGEAPLELGRRRLSMEHYRGYSWQASETDGSVQLVISNPGLPARVFQEPLPDAGAPTPIPPG